ncbi:hypothetical protein D3C86_1702630 [compost metagenome]
MLALNLSNPVVLITPSLSKYDKDVRRPLVSFPDEMLNVCDCVTAVGRSNSSCQSVFPP